GRKVTPLAERVAASSFIGGCAIPNKTTLSARRVAMYRAAIPGVSHFTQSITLLSCHIKTMYSLSNVAPAVTSVITLLLATLYLPNCEHLTIRYFICQEAK